MNTSRGDRASQPSWRAATRPRSKAFPGLLAKRDTRLAELEEEVRALKHRLAAGGSDSGEIRTEVKGVAVLARRSPRWRRRICATSPTPCAQRLGSGIVVLGMESDGKATLLTAVTDDLTDRVRAGDIIKRLADIVGGRGGGRANLAQAGGPDVAKLDEALQMAAVAVGELMTD